jgi:hypothetical protein
MAIEPVSLPATVWYPGLRADFRREDLHRLESVPNKAPANKVETAPPTM